MKAFEKLKRFLMGKKSSKYATNIQYVDTKVTSILTTSDDESNIKLEFHLENGRVFQKKFDKMSAEYKNYWTYIKPGDDVTLLICPDGIIRDIQ